MSDDVSGHAALSSTPQTADARETMQSRCQLFFIWVWVLGWSQRLIVVHSVLYEMSQLLDTGLDRTSLGLLVALCEQGLNPEALAAIVKEIRRETS